MSASLLPSGMPLAKRLFDLLASVIGLIILSPVLLIIAILIMIVAGRPIFFRQPRPGLRGEVFKIYKFRTMHNAFDSSGKPRPDSERLFALGRIMRTLSLDELPELINVLMGEMSLVGPRPLLVEYLSRYSAWQARRHEVLPGITGWAQVNGRNALTWKEKFELDVWYVDNWSFWLDLRILLMTLVKVFKREGISQPGQATASEFMGEDDS